MPRRNRIVPRKLGFRFLLRRLVPSRRLSKKRRPKMVPLNEADSNQIRPSCVAYFMFSAIETLTLETKGRIDPSRVKVGAPGEGDLGLGNETPIDLVHPRLLPLNYEDLESFTSRQWNYSQIECVLDGYIQRSRIALRQNLTFWQRHTPYEDLFWLISLIEFVACLRRIQDGYNEGFSNERTNRYSNDYNNGLEALYVLRDFWLTLTDFPSRKRSLRVSTRCIGLNR